tara:strand:- start:72 stop:1055 length:984 start_codon:yes stop_codon:yes gene_type:complete
MAMLGFTPQWCTVEEVEGERFGGHLMVVTLNRPRVRNALHFKAHAELSRVWDYYHNADHLFVAILTGAGDKAFCAGFDLKAAAAAAMSGEDEDDRTDHIDRSAEPDMTGCRGGSGFAGLTERRRRFKPIIAAVNGVAHGGGFETALSCDIIVAAETADFALPEPKVGLIALAGGVIRLPRLIGHHSAMEIMLTGRRVSAAEGLRLGFVQRVVPSGVVEEAMRIVDLILKCSPDSIQATVEVRRAHTHTHTTIVAEHCWLTSSPPQTHTQNRSRIEQHQRGNSSIAMRLSKRNAILPPSLGSLKERTSMKDPLHLLRSARLSGVTLSR